MVCESDVIISFILSGRVDGCKALLRILNAFYDELLLLKVIWADHSCVMNRIRPTLERGGKSQVKNFDWLAVSIATRFIRRLSIDIIFWKSFWLFCLLIQAMWRRLSFT